MSRADPTIVYNAINNGGTFSNGYIVVDGVANKCLLTNGVWSLDPDNGVKIYNLAHFNRMKLPNIVLSDPGEYQWAIADADGNPIGQLALVSGFARVIDP